MTTLPTDTNNTNSSACKVPSDANARNDADSRKKHMRLYLLISVCIWLTLWEVSALVLAKPLLLPDIFQTLQRLASEVCKPTFYLSIGGSLLHLSIGLFSGMLLGIMLGLWGAGNAFVHALFTPLNSLMKAVPIAAIVILLLLSMHAEHLAIPVVFFIVFPQFYHATREGRLSGDPLLIEMAQVYHMTPANKLRYLYPEFLNAPLLATMKSACGMAFKAGIAAEVIAISGHSIGEALYTSKITLDSAGVFAYILVILILSFGYEKLLLFLASLLTKRRALPNAAHNYDAPMAGALADASALHQKILQEINDSLQDTMSFTSIDAHLFTLSGPSGCGKTTLLHTMYKANDGALLMFQEDRLLPSLTPLQNVLLTCRPSLAGVAPTILEAFLPADALHRPVSTCSGGEKRRIALIRTMLSAATVFLLDEPYTGMDAALIQKMQEFIQAQAENRPVILTAHHS